MKIWIAFVLIFLSCTRQHNSEPFENHNNHECKPIKELLTVYDQALNKDDESILSELKPKEVVSLYCNLDANGSRLGGKLFKYTFYLVTWEDEPGWDGCLAIDSFNINKEIINGDSAKVYVNYSIIGEYDGRKYIADKKEEDIVFKLNKHNIWKISEPIIPPHVKSTALKQI